MNYNFIKDLYRPIVDDLAYSNASLKAFISERDNSFILNHNIDGLSKILRFMDSSDNVFILNGFMGSGKTYVADCFLDFISNDVLIFRNSYQEAINLDDVLLSMFKDFSIYHNEKNLLLPKVESSIFSEKINAYIKYCDAPMLFIFDSFEINLRNKDTQKDILDFINFLSHFEKVKVVICSRTFKQDDLISKDSSSSYSLTSLSSDEMFQYIQDNNIKGSRYECQELFKISRGHYLLLELAVLIMQVTGISLTNFLTEYKKSTKNFLAFLVNKVLSISSEKYIKLLLFLSEIRHGVGMPFFISQNFASEDDIDFLLQKHVISEKFGKYYLKDYIKHEFVKSINTETKIRVHRYILDVYNSELPLKPFDRLLFLSRLTMRQEIAHHLKAIDTLQSELGKSSRQRLSEVQDFTYLSYSHNAGFDNSMNNKPSSERRVNKNIKQEKNKNKRFELSNVDSLLLNASKPDDLITKHFENIVNTTSEEPKEEVQSDINSIPQSLDEYIDIAQTYENAYDFSSAITYYQKALTYTSDKMFEYKEPVIYTKLAICYKRIQNTDEAISYYEKVYNLYIKDNPEKANEILLSIAQIYSEAYKFDKAKDVYKRILYSPSGISKEMVIRVFLDLSELEDNNMDIEMAVRYAQKALSEAEKSTDTVLLCECYFKYASLLDDTGNENLASKFYLRCIQTSADAEINEYLASAYSNLAEISFDENNFVSSKMYFELSIEADKKRDNNEGLYYSYLKLAKILEEENDEKTHEYLVNALNSAKKLDDVSYQISAYIELGDYYTRNDYYKKALKSYVLVKSIAASNMLKDVEFQIDGKMNKIKTKLGEVEYLRLLNEIKNKK